MEEIIFPLLNMIFVQCFFIILDFGTKDLGYIFHFLSFPLACICKSLPNLADSQQGNPLAGTLHSPL